ncbi:MAG: HDOD domain-containing protein [Desulfobulbaceae bacterium]|nr:HDOD domain-containing protein [Desulfobulbaceae bacterium]HIJ78003.1 HDOD domain-containing protein [Deltaproteobacteria bacterium]
MTEHIDNEKIMAAIEKTPLIPANTAQLVNVCNDPMHCLRDIVHVAKHDAALTANILRVVNSAAFSRSITIDTIDRAVSLLGGDIIVGMALAETAETFFKKDLTGYGGHQYDLWRHDLRTAIASKKIAEKSAGKINADVAFTAGLLHDLGKAILSDFLQGTMEKILAAIDSGQYADYPTAEKEIVGVDHGYIGYLMIKKWNLPESILDAVRYHHEPAAAQPELRPLVYAVHLGDLIAMMSGGGTGADSMHCALDPEYKKYIHLSEDDFSIILLDVEEEYNILKSTLFDQGDS